MGIWFIDDEVAPSLLLNENDFSFAEGYNVAVERPRGCAVQLSNTKTAIIGGGHNGDTEEIIAPVRQMP